MFTNSLARYLSVGIIALTMATSVLKATAAEQTAVPPLSLKVYNNPDPKGFQVSSVIVMGQKDAILLDAQFTLADAHRVVAEILASGKNLTTVFVTQGDPDYYFGLTVFKQAFPTAKFVTTAAALKDITETANKKLEVWGPQLGKNGPTSVIFPEAITGNSLDLEGQQLQIISGVGAKTDFIAVWIPSIKAIVGGVQIFGDLHVWTADSQPKKERADWVKSLDKIAALKPDLVIPGHMKAGSAQNATAITFTRDYLITFENELAKAKDSTALIAAMKAHYPNAGLDIALEIGAKVNKGEMKW